jgi:hypothetical protein
MVEEITNAGVFIAVGFNQRKDSLQTKGFSQKIALLSLAKAHILHITRFRRLKPTAMKKNDMIFKGFINHIIT